MARGFNYSLIEGMKYICSSEGGEQLCWSKGKSRPRHEKGDQEVG